MGFVNKLSILIFLALQIKSMIQIFCKQVYKSNPRYKSLRFRLPKLDLQVCKSGFVKIWDLWICIFKDSFHAIVLRLCEDLSNSWKQAESWKIGWICDSQFETNIFKCGFVINDIIWIQDLFCKAGIEPFWSQDLWPPYNMNPWIHEMNLCFYESLILFPQPYYKLNDNINHNHIMPLPLYV